MQGVMRGAEELKSKMIFLVPKEFREEEMTAFFFLTLFKFHELSYLLKYIIIREILLLKHAAGFSPGLPVS